MSFSESSAVALTATGQTQVGPLSKPGVMVKYCGATVALTGTTTAAQVRIRRGSATGPIIDSFTLNTTLTTAQHAFEPGVDSGIGIWVDCVAISGGTVTADVVVYWL